MELLDHVRQQSIDAFEYARQNGMTPWELFQQEGILLPIEGGAQQTCAASLQFCALRVCVLDATGVPDPGVGNVYVTNEMITLSIEPENSAGDDFEHKNGCGDIRHAHKDRDTLKFLNLGLSLTIPDPELTAMLVGGTKVEIGGNVVGYAYPRISEQGMHPGVGLEGWSKRIISGQLASDFPYWRWVLPKSTWAIGPRTLANEFMVTEFTGQTEENDNYFDGPENDIPASVPTNRSMSYFADTAIPAATCGATELVAS